jgi:parvulin-like peptidyl-prolyl isomerase
MKRYLTISSWLVICIVAFGCRQKPSAENERERSGRKQVTKVAADGVAVTVNGVAVTEKEVEAEVRKMAIGKPPAYLEENREKIRRQVLDRMIAMSLIDEKIKAANIVVAEEEVLARIKEMAAQQRLSLDEFKAMLQARGMNYDEWEQQMQFERRIGFEKFAEVEFADQLTITESDANDFYTANIKRFGAPEQVKASHILIKPDATDPAIDSDEAY